MNATKRFAVDLSKRGRSAKDTDGLRIGKQDICIKFAMLHAVDECLAQKRDLTIIVNGKASISPTNYAMTGVGLSKLAIEGLVKKKRADRMFVLTIKGEKVLARIVLLSELQFLSNSVILMPCAYDSALAKIERVRETKMIDSPVIVSFALETDCSEWMKKHDVTMI